MSSSAQSSPQAGAGTNNKQKAHGVGKGACLDDDYMMYTYKVIPCSRVSTHNWKLCHFSHVGEVAARRRHPTCHQAELCAYIDANKECPLGDKCPYAHNTFESWLHPDKYKTTLCSYAGACTRKFCFFAHTASELRAPSKQAELRLPKTASLDTAGSVGTPNSSSNNSSSSSMVAAVQPNWTAAAAAAGATSNASNLAAAGMYLPTCQPVGNGTMHIVNGSMCYYATGLQQQLAAAAGMDGGSSGSMLPPGAQGLSAIVVSAPQLPVAAGSSALPLPIAGTLSGAPAGGMPFWDSSTLGRLMAPGGTPMAADGSSYATSSFMFDPASPSTPLTVSSVSPMSSPLMHVAVQSGNSSSNLQLNALQQALDGTGQQQQQQLLQHLTSIQQQRPQDLSLGMNGQLWALTAAGEPFNPHMASMFNLNAQNLPGGAPAGMNSSIGGAATAAAGSAAAAAARWPLTQQQQQQAGFAGVDVQVLSGGQGFRPVVQGSSMQPDLTAAAPVAAPAANDGSNGSFLAVGGGDASQLQLQQQLNMLTFAMVQSS